MLILASTSPRRRELLAAAGIAFEAREPIADETRQAEESPIDYVVRVAREKAISIAAHPGDIVLGADTIVCVQGEVLGKPLNQDDARRMLRSLSGRSHWVYTGFCLVSDRRTISDSVATEVVIDDLSNGEIDAYVESGEPLDKAGAYAIQGLASKFVREIRGCYQNVVGLPVSRVYRHLRALQPSL
jgi:septum formation protein